VSTGFLWHELYGWHDTGPGAGPLRARGWVEPGQPMAENEATKRRFRNLVEASGLLARLASIKARPATVSELTRFHTPDYVALVKKLSSAEGGPLGGLDAYCGPGSYEVALLTAGGAIAATEAVLDGAVDNAYALIRPPGHHADSDRGNGFCIFNNVVVAAMHARAEYNVPRLAIIDWDVHHGNGTQGAFYDSAEVLTISLHQDGWFPPGSGPVEDRGAEAGHGYNINIPLPPASGSGAYRDAFHRIVVPAIQRFAPDLIFVACGFDASAFDPMARQMLGPDDFRWMTDTVLGLAARLCGGRCVFCHEGGYHAGLVPFCGLAVLEQLSGVNTGIEDPFAPIIASIPGQELQAHQRKAVDRALAAAPLLA
jgi:acetoin utilization deacetylase AcuC-like enzyme